VSLIYHTEPTNEKLEKKEVKSENGYTHAEVSVSSQQSGESVESVLQKKRRAAVGIRI